MNDKFVPLESGDTISKVKGILVRPFPITSALDLAYIGVTANQVGDNLKRGYICVTATAGNAATAKKAIRFTFAWLVAPLKARLAPLCCLRTLPHQIHLSCQMQRSWGRVKPTAVLKSLITSEGIINVYN